MCVIKRILLSGRLQEKMFTQKDKISEDGNTKLLKDGSGKRQMSDTGEVEFFFNSLLCFINRTNYLVTKYKYIYIYIYETISVSLLYDQNGKIYSKIDE